VSVCRLGKREYLPTYELQKDIFRNMRARHTANLHTSSDTTYIDSDKLRSVFEPRMRDEKWAGTILLVEHVPGVYTMGRRDTGADLLTEDGKVRS
jgi:lipoate-protein ligase B